MKKRIASLILTVILLVTVLSVFSVPASAAGEPVELKLNSHENGIFLNGGDYIISSGDYTVDTFNIDADCILTIGRDAKVTVTRKFYNNSATIHILGALIVEVDGDDYAYNDGTIRVSCGGTFTGRINDGGTVTYDKHTYVDGVCSVCDHHCPHEWKDGVCKECGYHCPHDGNTCVECGKELHSLGNGAIGSTLSNGSLTIICTVAAAVVFGLGGFFIGTKKKKPALADGAENTDKE